MTAALLAIVVRLLPDREWRRAMLAEFGSLEGAGARRRFAVGCARAVVATAGVWLRLAGLCLVSAVPLLMFTAPGGQHDTTGYWIIGIVTALCVAAVLRLSARTEARTVAFVAVTAGLLWWAALLAFSGVRSHPQWALAVGLAAVVVAARRGREIAALGTAFATCLAIFVVSVGTYSALPRLAPDIAPANATDPLLENRIESTDPYVGELLLAALLGTVLIGAARRPRPELPG
jgi:hypothetical protein